MNYIKRPEMRVVSRERVIERVVEKTPTQPSAPLDINALANAIAQIIKSMPTSSGSNVQTIDEGFDNSKTMEKLAKSMTVQRGNNESNFAQLGNEHHTKTDKEEVNKTIDLLSNLND